jgi:Protein of unknown function (DUF3168)
MSAHWPLQEAMAAALGADAGVKALIGDPARIYDDVPRNPAFPYAVIGEGGETDWSSQSSEGVEARMTVTAWSRYAGRKEAKQIMDRIRTVLHDANLAVAGWRLINLRCENAEFGRGPGGAYRGQARFRAVLEKI